MESTAAWLQKQRSYSAQASGVMAPGVAHQRSIRKSKYALTLLPMRVSGSGCGWRIRFQWNHANASDASMPSNAAWEDTTSSEVKLAIRSG